MVRKEVRRRKKIEFRKRKTCMRVVKYILRWLKRKENWIGKIFRLFNQEREKIENLGDRGITMFSGE